MADSDASANEPLANLSYTIKDQLGSLITLGFSVRVTRLRVTALKVQNLEHWHLHTLSIHIESCVCEKLIAPWPHTMFSISWYVW